MQNFYNVAHRHGRRIYRRAGAARDCVCAVLSAGRVHAVAIVGAGCGGGLGLTPMQVALAWLLQRSPNMLLIPGTSSVGHLRENLAAAERSCRLRWSGSWMGLVPEFGVGVGAPPVSACGSDRGYFFVPLHSR